jgi:hypothetical protein
LTGFLFQWKSGPDVSSSLSAGFANEPRLEISKPDVIRPLVREFGSRRETTDNQPRHTMQNRTRVKPSRTYVISAVLQPLWRGYAAVVGGIVIVAVSASDRPGSAVIAWRVISTGRGSTDGSSTDAYRHSAAYGCATIDTAVVNADATNSNASAICEGVS